MTPTLIRYRTLPDRADENARLIEDVFAELASVRPAGLRYVALRLPDATFYHLVMIDPSADGSPISRLGAFRAFQSGIRERCLELPQSSDVTIVGSFRMVGE